MDQKSVLVADDDRFIREMLRVVLSSAGYNLHFAEDGLAAVEMAATLKPDLVLVDGLLPKLHGFEVCRAVKQMQNAPKVIMLTGIYVKPTYRYQIPREYGADAVLSKSVEPKELLECIARQINPEMPVALNPVAA